MGMVNSGTPADIFCNQFFTNLFVIYCAARNSLTCVPDAFTLKSQLSLYRVFHHKIINFLWVQKAYSLRSSVYRKRWGCFFLRHIYYHKNLHFLPRITWLSSAFHLRVCVIASKNLMDLLSFPKYCRKAEIKKRKTRLIDLIKNQNYQ